MSDDAGEEDELLAQVAGGDMRVPRTICHPAWLRWGTQFDADAAAVAFDASAPYAGMQCGMMKR